MSSSTAVRAVSPEIRRTLDVLRLSNGRNTTDFRASYRAILTEQDQGVSQAVHALSALAAIALRDPHTRTLIDFAGLMTDATRTPAYHVVTVPWLDPPEHSGEQARSWVRADGSGLYASRCVDLEPDGEGWRITSANSRISLVYWSPDGTNAYYRVDCGSLQEPINNIMICNNRIQDDSYRRMAAAYAESILAAGQLIVQTWNSTPAAGMATPPDWMAARGLE